MHESNSNDHFELESYNTADTIPVATFLRNEQLPDEIIKKQCIMKNIITEDDWNTWKNKVTIDYWGIVNAN